MFFFGQWDWEVAAAAKRTLEEKKEEEIWCREGK